MSVLRQAYKLLSNIIPNKVVYRLGEELAHKRNQHQMSLIGSHGTPFYLAQNVVINSPQLVEFGNNCAINEFVHILGAGKVLVGNGVWIANHASIVTETHPVDVEFIGDHPSVYKPVVVEDNVWIGSHAVILPGVNLGRSCIIGAGSVVTKDVPPYAIVTGVPARVKRYKSLDSTACIGNPRNNVQR